MCSFESVFFSLSIMPWRSSHDSVNANSSVLLVAVIFLDMGLLHFVHVPVVFSFWQVHCHFNMVDVGFRLSLWSEPKGSHLATLTLPPVQILT